MWRGKVLAQMVENALIVWEDLGSSPKYVNYVWSFCYWFFKDMYEYVISVVRYCWFVSIIKCDLT